MPKNTATQKGKNEMKFNIFSMNKELNELKEQLKISKSRESVNAGQEIDALKNTLKQKDEIIKTQLSNIQELSQIVKEIDVLKTENAKLKEENSLLMQDEKSVEVRAGMILAGLGVSANLIPESTGKSCASILGQYESMPAGPERFEFFKKYQREILSAQ